MFCGALLGQVGAESLECDYHAPVGIATERVHLRPLFSSLMFHCVEPWLCGFTHAFELVLGPFLPAGYFAPTPTLGPCIQDWFCLFFKGECFYLSWSEDTKGHAQRGH